MKGFEESISSTLTKDLFVFYYQGSFLSKPGIGILDVLEKNIESVLTRKISKRAFFFGIEIIQNIEKYSANSDLINDVIALIKTKNEVQLYSENAILNSDVEKLKGHLDNVLGSTREELNELHYDRLTNSLGNDTKSPGLGLIELKRRGKEQSKLEYEFEKVNDDYSIYKLKLILSEDKDLNYNNDIYNLLKTEYNDKKSAVFYSGLFTNKLLSPIIDLIENLSLVNDKTIVSKYQHCIIEMIQNANEHGGNSLDIGGFFSLVHLEECIRIGCCNVVSNLIDLDSKVNELSEKNYEELQELNKAQMLDFSTDGGLGFIQLAQYSYPSPLISKTFLLDDSYNYFYIENQFNL